MANCEPKEVTRETQIQFQLSWIEQQVEEIERCSLSLIKQLTPILVPSQPRCENEKSELAFDVPLANQLNNLKHRLEMIATDIKDVSSRCEL